MQFYCEFIDGIQTVKNKRSKDRRSVARQFCHPIRVQTMTTTDTMDTLATVEQSIRCIEAGAELVRITAPSKKDAENLLQYKK